MSAVMAPPVRPELRDYQRNTITATRVRLAALPKGGRRVVVQMATGAGKTFTAAELISLAEQRGNRTLFVCDTLELVEQALAAFDAYGLKVGVIQARHERTDWHRPTQVCSQATLSGLLKHGKLDGYRVDLVVHDEAHQQYRVRDMLAEQYPDAVVIGLTATPFAKGMGQFYGDIVSAVPMQQLIDEGHLCDYRVYAPSEPSMKGVKASGGDWQADAAAKAYDGKLVADIVKTWQAHGQGRQTLMFACNVAHSKRLVTEFQAAGVNAVHVDGYDADEADALSVDRHKAIAAYRRGEIDVLSSVALCTKGFDAPETACVIVARPTKSLSLWWQILGRGLRRKASGGDCIVLDHSGNCLRHGFPTDVTDFTLHDGTKPDMKPDAREKGEKLPVPCPKCGVLKRPAGVHVCPACSFAPAAQDGVVNVDGELVMARDIKPKKGKHTMADKGRWWAELSAYAEARDKPEAWVHAKYRAKFGCPATGIDRAVRAEPTKEVKGWLTSQAIRYANRRERA